MLARAVNEALVFSGSDAGVLDVAFFAPDHPVVAKLLAVGMVFDIPEPQTRSGIATEPPGSNPDRPPKLR